MRSSLFVIIYALAGAFCLSCAGADVDANPDIRLHPEDVQGIPVLWLGEAYDQDGDGVDDLPLVEASIYAEPELRHPGTNEVIRPEIREYTMVYGRCEIAEDEEGGCPVPLSLIVRKPCPAHPLADGIVYKTEIIRGAEGQFYEGGLRLDSDEFSLTIHATGDSKQEQEDLAKRVVEKLKGANAEAAAIDVGTGFAPPKSSSVAC